jgi:hypothetical protein
MKIRSALALLVAAVAVSGMASAPARAAQGITIRAATAGELADLCGTNPREPGADAKINFCHGFAQGAIDVARTNLADKKIFCFPSSPPSRTATLAEFVNWVRALPEHRSLSSTDGLFKFMAERFPCK